jgi:hypothetical protein
MRTFWGPTGDCATDEFVGRVAHFPNHFKDEALDPMVLFGKRQLKERSISLVRLSYTCPNEIDHAINRPALLKKSQEAKAYCVGVLVAVVGDVRAIKNKINDAAFELSPDGKRDIAGHAHLGYARSFDPNEQLRIRTELADAFFSNVTSQGLFPDRVACCSWARSTTSSHHVPVLTSCV